MTTTCASRVSTGALIAAERHRADHAVVDEPVVALEPLHRRFERRRRTSAIAGLAGAARRSRAAPAAPRSSATRGPLSPGCSVGPSETAGPQLAVCAQRLEPPLLVDQAAVVGVGAARAPASTSGTGAAVEPRQQQPPAPAAPASRLMSGLIVDGVSTPADEVGRRSAGRRRVAATSRARRRTRRGRVESIASAAAS